MKTKFEFSAKAHPDTWQKRSLSLSGVGEGYSLFSYQKDNRIFLVAMRLGETPVLNPNTMVKT